MSDESDNNQANEARPEYGKNRIRFYYSFEEMNEVDYELAATLSPEQCLINLNQMLRSMFAEELSKGSSISSRLVFDK